MKQAELRLFREMSLPLEVITERNAAVGQSGSGKTYLAMRLAELMLDVGAQVAAIDPQGVWWGLLSSKDGKGAGYAINVFGGEHAHVPIVPEAGSLVAEVIIERQLSAVVDVSDFTVSQQVQFSSAFAERLFDLQKRAKRPMHLFIEEAQTFLPQNLPPEGRGGDPAKNPAVMLNRFERIIRRGRSYGIGCTMVTQQPQAVSKRALNQAGTLFAMRTLGKHERKAIAEWMADKATAAEQLDLDSLLSTLDTGHAWVASPHFLGAFKRVATTTRTTYDSSATPKFGVRLEAPRVLADVDIAGLRDAMKTVVDETERDDPKKLRKRIAELEHQLAAKPAQEQKPVEVKVPLVSHEDLSRLEQTVGQLRDASDAVKTAAETVHSSVSTMAMVRGAWRGVKDAPVMPTGTPRLSGGGHAPPRRHTIAAGLDPLGPKAVKMLGMIACLRRPNVSRRELALLMGYSAPDNSAFREQLYALTGGGYVVAEGGGVTITREGLDLVGPNGPLPPDAGETLQLWLGKLQPRAGEMLKYVVSRREATRATMAAEFGYSAPDNSAFREVLYTLTGNGLVHTQHGMVYADQLLTVGARAAA